MVIPYLCSHNPEDSCLIFRRILMKTLFTSVRCLECEHEIEADLMATGCPACGGVWLDARYDYAALPADWPTLVAQRPTNMWRYWELLPFPEDFKPISNLDQGRAAAADQFLQRSSSSGYDQCLKDAGN
jgi:threonine synthase